MLRVVTRVEPPYVMVRCENCTGNERYEGFAIDLLQAISQVEQSVDLYYILIISLAAACQTNLLGKLK